ncbi:MAG TPA: aminotransferase class III-fold pyridoxal phosphate-dependent enzyme [Gemmatimonadaceae bacterium]
MPLGRFFRGRQDEPAPDESQDTDDVAGEEVADESEPESVPPEWEASPGEIELSWRARAADAIPGGSSTGSKRASALYGDANEHGPTHFTRASGCRLVTPIETTLIDCTMALGSVAIGYADERIVRAAGSAAALGHVAGLAHTAEVELAERLCDLIPCAEQVRFLKTGGDAMSAAVRLARAATGRSTVVGCGYFGWHDWSSSAPGVTEGTRRDYHTVPFDDVPALESACGAAGRELAAVVLEPVIERLPSNEWLRAARRLCDELGAVLVFDEMKTGFRFAAGGYQAVSGVTPDLAAFGKAMANGFPLAAVVGRRDVMMTADRTWISSTLAGEAMSIAAALAVLDVFEEDDPCPDLARVGGAMRDAVAAAVAASGVPGASVLGPDPMWLVRFEDPDIERRFLEESVREGVLFKRGAWNYAALAHDEEATLIEIERAASSALVAVVDELSEPDQWAPPR